MFLLQNEVDVGFTLENCIISIVPRTFITKVLLEIREYQAGLPITFNVCLGFFYILKLRIRGCWGYLSNIYEK